MGCSAGLSSDTTLAKRLAERGPVELSPDNPFIASNLLLTKEMAKSPELKGFIEHRGQPSALEVERGLLGGLKLTLFYADKSERYAMELVDDTWIISSPESLASPAALKTVPESFTSPAQTAPVKAPPSEAPELAAEAVTVSPAADVQASSAPEVMPPPTVVAASRVNSAEAVEEMRASAQLQTLASAAPRELPPLPESRAVLVERLIKSAGSNSAEVTPKGDIVHYVTDPAETLSLIAEWYTDSSQNTARLSRINALRPGAALSPGDTIVIPRYLAANTRRLTDEAIAALKEPEAPLAAAPAH